MKMKTISSFALAGVAATSLAACGSSGPKSNGVAAKSADQILSSAVSAAEAAHSVHVGGTITESGASTSLDLDLVTGKGASGTITQGTASFALIEVGGDIYIKGNNSFNLKNAKTRAAARLIAGKWLRAPAGTSTSGSFDELTTIKGLMGALVQGHGKLAKGSSTKLGAQKAIGITDTTKGGTLDVATTGPAYPLQISQTGAKSGKVTFSQWNGSFTIAAPKSSISISQLAGGAPAT